MPLTKGRTTGMSVADFVVKAIEVGRNPGYKGIHAVYSGLNAAMRQEFEMDGAQVIAAQKALVADRVIVTVPTRGGPMIYLTADAPERAQADAKVNKLLSAIRG